MNILGAFRRFWYVDTIDAMQARMLRDVRMRQYRQRMRPIHLGSCRTVEPRLLDEPLFYRLSDGPLLAAFRASYIGMPPEGFRTTLISGPTFGNDGSGGSVRRAEMTPLFNPAKGRYEYVNKR